MTKDNKKMKSKNKKHTLGKPDAYLLLLFTIEIIFVIWVFFNGGKDFFINDTAKIGILLPLGLLTFVSVFFGFIFSQKELMKAFIDRMSKIDSKFKKELKGYKDGIKDIEDYKDIEDIKDWIGRYKEFKEYKRFVNPILWLYVSIFLSLITIDRKSTRLNSSHIPLSRMPSSA